MQLNVKAMALTGAIIWGGAVLLVCLANWILPGYGGTFLKLVASIYPGYYGTQSFGQVLVGTLYALVDGAIGGLVFGWLYNLFAGRGSSRSVP